MSKAVWNKGLTSETSESVAKHSLSLKEYYKTHNGSMKGKKHSQETKEKISRARKKYLSEHPEKIPFKLNHSSIESYPEKYFRKWLIKNKLFDKQEFQVSLYSLDFAWPDKMIYLEVDGSQHKLAYMQKHDAERTENLNSLGWTLIYRVDWEEYQKLNRKEKHELLEKIKYSIVSASILGEYITKKTRKQLYKQQLINEGRVDCAGRLSGNMLSKDEWEERFNRVITCGVDISKFGWREKVKQCTGLTTRQLDKLVKRFNYYFSSRMYKRGT